MNGEPTGLLAAIVHFSLRFRGVVIALACVLLGYCFFALEQANYDVFPEFAPPQVVIQTEAQGLTAEQVEVLVTQPIENAINGVAGIERLSSNSIQGLSVITVIFKSNSDIFRDRQVVAERLATLAGQLPQGGRSGSGYLAADVRHEHSAGRGAQFGETQPDGTEDAGRLDPQAENSGDYGSR